MGKISIDDLPEEQQRHLEYLLTHPRERRTTFGVANQKEWAEKLGRAPRTLRDWQQSEPFRTIWQEMAMAMAGGPERTQRLLDALYEAGTDPEARDRVSAAKLWFQVTGAISPAQTEEMEKNSTKHLTDAQVRRLLEQYGQSDQSPIRAVK